MKFVKRTKCDQQNPVDGRVEEERKRRGEVKRKQEQRTSASKVKHRVRLD